MSTNSIEFNFEYMGNRYQCFYALKDHKPEVIHVSTPWGPREAELGDKAPLVVARLLAGELARESHVR